MNKRANVSRLRFLAGAIAALPLLLAGAAEAQQAYYFPQGSSAPVSIDYGALTPYAARPGAFQPYGYALAQGSSQPRSAFTPYGAPAYPVPAYAVPAYSRPAYMQPAYMQPAYVQPGYVPLPFGYAAASPDQPFVAPYANPAFASGLPVGPSGLPLSTPTGNGQPASYLNVPGYDDGSAAEPTKKKRKKMPETELPMPASTATATEEAAAAQVAAAEAVLESGPAPVAPAAEPVAEATPVEPPTPPAEPTEVPATVPSPAADMPVAAAPAQTPATDEAAAEQSASVAPATDAAPAEEAPLDASGSAPLPAGATRIVFEGESDDLPQGATGELDAIADRMLADETIKVQVLAYSSGDPSAESQARRKALARGLEVRKYLIGKGVRSNRIDVRALGSKSEGTPADRVDIVPVAG